MPNLIKQDCALCAGAVEVLVPPRRMSNNLQLFVLCSVVLAQRFVSTELASPFIVLVGLLLMTFGKILHGYAKMVWPLVGVLVVGFMGVYDQESRNILRDISFALTPICLIYIGHWIAGNRSMWPFILKVLVALAFILAVVHLKTFVIHPMLLTEDVGYVRGVVGGGSGNLVVFALVLVSFGKRLGISDLYPRLLPRFIVMPVLLVSFVLSYSRTGFMVAIVFSLALMGALSRINLRFVITIAVVMAGCITLVAITSEGDVGSFRSKIVGSFTEISISDYQNIENINKNWRGFESYRAVKTFSSGDILQKLFGQGFGALVDLGFSLRLGGEGAPDFRYIPVTHNGYVYILIKVGLMGLIFYALFYIYIIKCAVRYSQSINKEQKILARLLLGSVLSLVMVMYVVGGMAQMHDVELVLLMGYLMRKIRQYQLAKGPALVGRVANGCKNI